MNWKNRYAELKVGDKVKMVNHCSNVKCELLNKNQGDGILCSEIFMGMIGTIERIDGNICTVEFDEHSETGNYKNCSSLLITQFEKVFK